VEILDYWKFCDDYSIMHAALLASGHVPSDVEDQNDELLNRDFPGYVPVRTALFNAVITERISEVKIVYDNEIDSKFDNIDLRKTMIKSDALDQYFKDRGHSCLYFARNVSIDVSDNKFKAKFYSAKLDAANKAWSAVTSNPGSFERISPKQALREWLEANADQFGLIKKDGTLNDLGIEDVAKVANWKPVGGATPTFVTTVAASNDPPEPPSASIRSREIFSADLEDETPF